MIDKPKGRKHYRIKFQFQGRTIQRRTRVTTAKAAREIEATLRTELGKGNFGILTAAPAPELGNFLRNEFLPFTKSRFAAKPKSAAYYAYGASLLLKSDLARLPLDKVTSQNASAFATKHSKLSPSSINCGLRTLRRAIRLGEQWGKIAKSPVIELVSGERQRDRVLSEIEFLAYYEACRQPWRDVVTLLYGTGMRPGEAYQLRWEHVLLNGSGGVIQIAEGKTKAARRLLPMVPEVYGMLLARWEEQLKPKQGWVFPSHSMSGHFDENSAKNQHVAAIKALQEASAVWQQCHKAGNDDEWAQAAAVRSHLDRDFLKRHADAIRAGFKTFAPYVLRHTALTRLAEAGADVFTLAKIAGHSSIAITQRYVHPAAEAIERVFLKRQKLVPTGGSQPTAVLSR